MSLKKFYYWLYRVTSRSDERGEYAGGRYQGLVRAKALELCKGIRGKVLEIGFGSGLFAIKLAAQEPGLEVWGIDQNGLMLSEVRAKADSKGVKNLHLVLGDARALSFSEGSFDAVICVNLFLNIGFEAMAEVLDQMKRVCKRDGRIIFEFRNSRNLFFRLKYKFVRLYDEYSPYPLYTFSPGKVDELLRGMGLEVTARTFVGFPVKWCAPIVFIEATKR